VSFNWYITDCVTDRQTDARTRSNMPRLVDDQRYKFYNDELFRKLSRESEVSNTQTSAVIAGSIDSRVICLVVFIVIDYV